MKTVFKNYNNIHPMMRAMLAFNEYDHDDRENVISATSIMKPTNMVVLERSNKNADRAMDIEGMIPSVGGNALHNMLEAALNGTTDEVWKGIGIPNPEELTIHTEIREETPIDKYIISGKYDILFKYESSKWQLGDLKSMSVWGVMINKQGKIDEWKKQMSIYRYLNQDKDIDDIAIVLTWFTDWSKTDSIAKAGKGYPQQRTDVEFVELWSLDKTKIYLETQAKRISLGMDTYAKTGKTSLRCSDDELWMKKPSYAFYAKGTSKRATKLYETEEEAMEAKALAKDFTSYYIERKGEATRCKYCAVTAFCDQYAEHVASGLVKI